MNKIFFGNNEAFFLDNKNKQYIIDYLYDNIDLSNFRYIMLNTISKLKFLQENIHFVSPNYKGINYLLIMLNINNENLYIIIDRKQLSYHKHQLNITNLKILKINIESNYFYNNSIFDGKLINKNNKYTFLIQDCFLLLSNKITDILLEQKIEKMTEIVSNIKSKNCDFKLIKLFNYSELDTLISEVDNTGNPGAISNTDNPGAIPEAKLPNKNDYNGIIFYPKKSGINIIFINKINDTNNINNGLNTPQSKIYNNGLYTQQQQSEHNNNNALNIQLDKVNNNNLHDELNYTNLNNFNYLEYLKSIKYSYELNPVYKRFWISKTSIPDVYNIHTNKYDTEGKIGIACVPNLKISYKLNEIITNDNPIEFECIFYKKLKKWIPINKV